MSDDNNNDLIHTHQQMQQQQQMQLLQQSDPFYKKSLLVTQNPIQSLRNEINYEIMEDLRNKVKDLDKDDWMYETSSHHFRH